MEEFNFNEIRRKFETLSVTTVKQNDEISKEKIRMPKPKVPMKPANLKSKSMRVTYKHREHGILPQTFQDDAQNICRKFVFQIIFFFNFYIF